MTTNQLTYSRKDTKGQFIEQKWIDKSFFHPGTRRIVTVIGFIWNTSTDEWNVYYSCRGAGVNFCKAIEEFRAKFVEIENGEPSEDD